MHIILVEPSRTVTKIICDMLEENGHEIRPFADGREALEYLKSDSTVEALITAGEPLSISGPQLCAEARTIANGKRPIYLLLMSASADNNRLINALDLGADEFINKPLNREELWARLRAAERSVRQKQELIRLADTDALTGLRNRRSFFEAAKTIMERANLISAVMFDIDHFKRVNDTFGHDVGDQVLKLVAAVAQSVEPTVGRLGGEEFAIILEGKSICAAFQTADSLRARISNLRFDTEQGSRSVTCSFGVSERQSLESVDQLLKRADVALYEAKSSGRNRVCPQKNNSSTEKLLGSVVGVRSRTQPFGTDYDVRAGRTSPL